jgi:hypothetical protein
MILHSSGAVGAAVLLLGLGACAQRPPNLSVTDRDTLTACRTHADQVYDRNNRGAIYSVGANDAPSSSIGRVGDPTAVLSDRYARDRMIERCVRGTGNAAAQSYPVPAPPPPR